MKEPARWEWLTIALAEERTDSTTNMANWILKKAGIEDKRIAPKLHHKCEGAVVTGRVAVAGRFGSRQTALAIQRARASESTHSLRTTELLQTNPRRAENAGLRFDITRYYVMEMQRIQDRMTS